MFKEYDIIVVGGGHAGCEAAAAAANMGSSVLLISMNLETLAQMSCNPAMGGIAKGQIVREIDALGGMSGIITDKTMIQFRMLNLSKGPAMWSPRAQSDRMMFSKEWRKTLEGISNIDFWQDNVTSILTKNEKVIGVKTSLEIEIYSKAVILTNGTFLNGLIHIGEKSFSGGRIGEKSSHGITESLKSIGFESNRMKTGTPVRVDGRSLNYSVMQEQFGDENPQKFSYTDTPKLTKQKSCYLTYTNEEVHDILRTGFDKSPLFVGRIKGIGPRYCPSIEDKIERFSDKNRHQIFVEPEGWETNEIYVNGFSSSLPEDIQFKALKKIPGFENAKIFRPGYAIEYDFFPPTQLRNTLETKCIENLYFAGQINGTTGYEEAASQGLMAGINAHRKINNLADFVLKRSEAYIGVLIDDLVTKGTEEPYRMFTSRAEYRILLRQDDADLRLTPLSFEIGLASKDRLDRVNEKKVLIDEISSFVKATNILPTEVNSILEENLSQPISQKTRLSNLLLRPQINFENLLQGSNELRDFISQFQQSFINEVIEEVEILIKYEGYISKEQESAQKLLKLENIELHDDFDYKKITSLSSEAREKLSKIKPRTIGQASRISGVSPSDVSVLIVFLKK
ncbi:MAG: tRNA uridine-5-carboxymethylaminomethyl(34) synthesis enzyme MnmG [Bacteroidetes bacterium]|nr:tRNA uridine-5-carboxymethylaminomethyl(34) synthesis enzyme MnmG [Bacteroidota bacterium]